MGFIKLKGGHYMLKLKTYNLLNPKGTKLQLILGVDEKIRNESTTRSQDKGYRWCFKGTNIPMPVRNGTWFNGFKEDTMLLWLAEHDWHVQSCVYMRTGEAKVYDLPNGNEDGKSNLKISEYAYRYVKYVAYRLRNHGDENLAITLLQTVFNIDRTESETMLKNIISEINSYPV